jgi:hypothetical protein
MFRLLPLLSVLSAASAASPVITFDTTTRIPATSPFGTRLLSKAKRALKNNNDDSYDFTWVTDYSIKFHSCHTTLEFRSDGGGSGDAEENASPTESLRLVRFQLCPSASCSKGCTNGADYLVEMREFAESYLEFQMNQHEYNCETVKDNCSCDDDTLDDETCQTQCYAKAGLDYCEENDDNNKNDFEIDRYLECEQVNNGNDDGTSALYVGAYCSDNGKSIFLGAFTNRQCTKHTSVDAYKTYTGYDLPYTSTSIVSSSNCVACKEPSQYDDDYNADKDDADSVVEICEELYQRSAKCETKLQNVATRATGGCDYIFNTLPQAERIAKGASRTNRAAVWLAAIFFCTTMLMTAYAFFLYRKITRKQVNLLTKGEGQVS